MRKEDSKKKCEAVDIVAISGTQFGNITKLKETYLGLYEKIAAENHDRYGVEKLLDHEVPGKTST